VWAAHSLLDPQVVDSNQGTAYFHIIVHQLSQAEITVIVFSGRFSSLSA